MLLRQKTTVRNGATPILIGIGDDHNMDVTQLEKVVTTITKAIIPVHLNVRLCNVKKLMEIAAKRDLIVVEDAAEAL
jgi:dTDP-4-amino-4,6-dideoxygalactose transaminase